MRQTELFVGHRRRDLEGLAEWEQELVQSLDNDRVDLDDAPAECAKYRVERMELVPARNTRNRFAF